MHLDAGHKIREQLRMELSATQEAEETAQVKAAAAEKKLVDMQAQAADEKASMANGNGSTVDCGQNSGRDDQWADAGGASCKGTGRGGYE